jgi:DNA-binding GntR family transcriptional regulator
MWGVSSESGERPGELLAYLKRPPRRQMLGDEVYEDLKKLIMNHVIAPGAKLNIDALARELGTSSTPIREALARLESDGLASKMALRGYSATLLMSRQQFDDLYGLRLLLEPWAAGRAAAGLDDEGAALLEREMESRPLPPDSPDYEVYREFSSHDARLHDLVLRLAGNEAVRQALARTHAHLHLFRLGYGQALGASATSEHQDLVAAIRSGEPPAAEAAMRDHLCAARDRLKATPALRP